MSTKSLSDQETRRVRARLGELVDHYGSQFQAAMKTDISQQTISNILRGSAVGRDVAKRVAEHDGVPVEQLLGPAVPRALEVLLRNNREQWPAHVVAAVRRWAVDTDDVEKLSADDWTNKLEQTEAALKTVLVLKDVARRRGR